MEVTTSTKGKPCALYEGYSYNFRRENPQGVKFWLCTHSKSKRCSSYLKTKDGEVLSSGDHSCGAPDVARLEVLKSIENAKKRAREEETAITKIYQQEIGGLHNRGYQFVTEMTAQTSTKRTLRKHRHKSQGHTAEPEKATDVILDEDLLKMEDGSSFLLMDDNAGERILIFSGASGKEALSSCEHFFMDGTFKSCSKQFTQIYSIHADYGSSSDETNVHPVAFALLPDKRRNTYIRLFNLMKETVPNWNPKTINVDFEPAVISALKEVFNNVEVKGCYFHMKKCLWRKVQDVGLTKEFRENDEIRSVIKMCASLALLKPEDVSDGWVEIHSQAPDHQKLNEFIDYFVLNWLENENNPVDQWNCHGKRHRTTNAVEGWNSRVNSLIKQLRPKIKELITTLKFEAENSASLFMRKQMNLEGKRRKLKYKKIDDGIQRTIEKYEETGDIRTCLQTLSYLQKFD